MIKKNFHKNRICAGIEHGGNSNKKCDNYIKWDALVRMDYLRMKLIRII